MFSQRSFLLFLFLIVDPAGIRTVLSQSAPVFDLKTYSNGTKIHHKWDLNPLHILCLPCKLVSGLLGGIVGGLLGGILGENLIKQLGIFGCSYTLSIPLRFPFVPNLICVAVFEIIGIISKKATKGNSLCQTLFLCSKNKASTYLVSEFATLSHEDRIMAILESDDTANLPKEMENFYDYLYTYIAPENINGTDYEFGLRHSIRNFVAAVSYQIDHIQQQQKQ